MKTEISVESKHQTLQGLAFPLQPGAQRALQQLRQKTINYIQLVGARPARPRDPQAPRLTPAGPHAPVRACAPTPPAACPRSSPVCWREHPRPYLSHVGATAVGHGCALLLPWARSFVGRGPVAVPPLRPHTAHTGFRRLLSSQPLPVPDSPHPPLPRQALRPGGTGCPSGAERVLLSKPGPPHTPAVAWPPG